jgi:tRNA threonylcarbamoyl adenosine modification protein YeaZ
MRILAIDTSLEACAVGIDQDDLTAAAVILSETIGRGHAERLFGMITAALLEAHVTLADIERFAVTVGPGSFTGIRVGIAAVRGFALATKKPAIGISNLAVHAESARAAAGGRPIRPRSRPRRRVCAAVRQCRQPGQRTCGWAR